MKKVWLPVQPLTEFVREHLERSNRVVSLVTTHEGDHAKNAAQRLAWACMALNVDRSEEAWKRRLHAICAGEQKVVELNDADVVLLAIGDGTSLDDLWPDFEAAVAEGYRLKYPIQKRAA